MSEAMESDFFSWTIKAIRDDASKPTWLEDRKSEWVPLVEHTLRHIILDAYTVILLSDKERCWFVEYALGYLNSSRRMRPFFPIYAPASSIASMLSPYNARQSTEMIPLIRDMLSISFGEKYLFWYVGRIDDFNAKLAFSHDYNFNWILDEQMSNSFSLSSVDETLDIKLLQLLRIFDKSLSAALFGEIVWGG